jgi:[acyl-carrier-protein] S-malonyltransferase
MIAFVFPGQGAQAVGMGRDLAQAFPEAAAVFAEVDDALSEPLSRLIWEGEAEALQLTRNAQPALMATSMAALAALRALGLPDGAMAVAAGHSLGEFSALCAAGALTLAQTARLLRLRGEAMQAAVPVGAGAMAALLGLSFAEAAAVAARAQAEGAPGETVEAANDNDPAQVVVSGHRAAVERAVALAREMGARRAVLLPVSAPFHSTLMRPAAEALRAALAETAIRAPRVPVVANVTAAPETDPDRIRALLVEQVTGSVRWRESVLRLAAMGATEAWEIGPGRALSGMIRRTAPALATRAVATPEEARDALLSLAGAA